MKNKAIYPNSKTRMEWHKQAIFTTSFTFLTGGVFLTGLAIYMGANDLLTNYISMITNICGISILFFSSIIAKFNSYKKTTIFLTVVSKIVTLLIILIPLIVPYNLQITIFIPIMIVAFTLQSQTTVVLNNWMVTFIDEKLSGKYVAKRQIIVLLITVILAFAGGKLMDSYKGAYIGFAILFIIAFFMAIGEIIILLRIPDAIQKKSVQKKTKFIDIIKVPIKNKTFLCFVLYIFLFYLVLSIADSFTTVYMIKYLKLDYTTTTAMQMIISLPQIFLLGIWGRISDKKGHKFTLIASIWFFIGETLFMALSNQQNFYIFIPTAFLFAAIGNSGFIVSVFNHRYELMPKDGRILYDNFYTAAVGLAFILGPVTGNAIKHILESINWVSTIEFGNIRLLYAISTVSIVLLQLIIHLLNINKKSPNKVFINKN